LPTENLWGFAELLCWWLNPEGLSGLLCARCSGGCISCHQGAGAPKSSSDGYRNDAGVERKGLASEKWRYEIYGMER